MCLGAHGVESGTVRADSGCGCEGGRGGIYVGRCACEEGADGSVCVCVCEVNFFRP